MRRSNCLVEAIRAWWRHPLTTRLKAVRCGIIPHFFWIDTISGRTWHFRAADYLPLWRVFWFRGEITQDHMGRFDEGLRLWTA